MVALAGPIRTGIRSSPGQNPALLFFLERADGAMQLLRYLHLK